MDLKDKKITWKMNEVTINKTKSKYTVTFSLENPNLLSVQMIDRVVGGKNRRTGSPSCVEKQKTTANDPSGEFGVRRQREAATALSKTGH